MMQYSVQYKISAQDALSPSLKKLQKQFSEFDKTLKNLSKPVTIKVNYSTAFSKVKKINEALAKIKSQSIVIKVNAQEAITKLRKVTSALVKIKSLSTANLTTKIDTSKADRKIDKLRSSLLKMRREANYPVSVRAMAKASAFRGGSAASNIIRQSVSAYAPNVGQSALGGTSYFNAARRSLAGTESMGAFNQAGSGGYGSNYNVGRLLQSANGSLYLAKNYGGIDSEVSQGVSASGSMGAARFAQLRMLAKAKRLLNTRIGGRGESATGMGRGNLFATMAGAALISSATKAVYTYSEALVNLKKAISDPAFRTKTLENQARGLSRETGKTSAEVLDMMASAKRSGIEVKNLSQYTKDAVKVSTSFVMNSDAASQAMISLRSAFFSGEEFKTQEQHMMKFAGAIAYVADKSAATETYLMSFLPRAASVTKVMGVSREALLAYGATAKAVNIKPEKAGRGLRTIISRLASLYSAPKKLSQLGFNQEGYRKSLIEDPIGMIFKLINSSKKFGKVKQVSALKSIFGQNYAGDAITIASAIKIYDKNLKNANNTTAQASKLDANYALQLNSKKTSFDRFTSSVQDLLRVGFDDYLVNISNAAKSAMYFFTDHPVVAKMGAALVIAATGAALLSGALFVVGTITMPIMLAVGAVALLGSAIMGAGRESKDLRGAISDLFTPIDRISSKASDAEHTFLSWKNIIGALVMLVKDLNYGIDSLMTHFAKGNVLGNATVDVRNAINKYKKEHGLAGNGPFKKADALAMQNISKSIYAKVPLEQKRIEQDFINRQDKSFGYGAPEYRSVNITKYRAAIKAGKDKDAALRIAQGYTENDITRSQAGMPTNTAGQAAAIQQDTATKQQEAALKQVSASEQMKATVKSFSDAVNKILISSGSASGLNLGTQGRN